MVNTFDRGRSGASFEFSAPRYCNLAVELERDLRYENVDEETGSDWFEREHPLHEPEERPPLQPALSPSEWGEPQGARLHNPLGSIGGTPTKDQLEILKSPDLDSRTARSLQKTPLSGSARRVRRKHSPPVETVFEVDKTRRVLKFDDGEDEEPPAPARKRRRDPVVHPMREERQAREVELLLRKHNRELEARKRGERLTKAQTRQRNVPNAELSETVSPPRMNAVDEPNKGHHVAYLNDNEESGLQQMLEEHNRKVREARKRGRSQSQLHPVPEPNTTQSSNSHPENMRTRTKSMAPSASSVSAPVTAPEPVRTRHIEKASLKAKSEKPEEADKENLASKRSKVQQVAQTRHKSRVRGNRLNHWRTPVAMEMFSFSQEQG
mmetsp:Transcript_7802/g.34756  ORF Transcript_7802/g.34756 Transcript_7802/m.34756 type:complete len:381 (-) Transcript_7802:1952-3094(-)